MRDCQTSRHFRLIVTVPNGGEMWSIGSSQTIRWSSSGVSGSVKIEISRDAGMSWSTLSSKTSNDGAQKWNVKGPATTLARLRICSLRAPITCGSGANFTIR
jgi:hypothetical protein